MPGQVWQTLHCGFSPSADVAEKSSGYFEINRKSTVAMRMIGRGREGLRKVCAVLDLPPPVTKKNYQQHCTKLFQTTKSCAIDSMRCAAHDLKAKRTTDGQENPQDVAVSVDGTWMKRGFSSLYGVQTAISWDGHKVLDVEILSRYCSTCTSKRAQVQKGQVSQ